MSHWAKCITLNSENAVLSISTLCPRLYALCVAELSTRGQQPETSYQSKLLRCKCHDIVDFCAVGEHHHEPIEAQSIAAGGRHVA